MTVKLYRSTDTGSPVLGTTSDGSLLTILRACLVDGYGTRTAAGWTLQFSDLPNKIGCFKSVTGDTIRLDDDHDYRWATATGFKSMSTIDEGLEQYPSSDNIGAGNEHRVYKRYNTASNYGGWLVIASDNWFYYVSLQDDINPTYPAGFFFGEYDCINPSFTENSMITGSIVLTTYTSMTTATKAGLYSPNAWYARRNYQNGAAPTVITMELDSTDYANPNPFSGSLELEKVPLRATAASYVHYGSLPNHLHMLGSSGLGYYGGEVFEIATVKYVVLAQTSYAYAVQYDVDVG